VKQAKTVLPKSSIQLLNDRSPVTTDMVKCDFVVSHTFASFLHAAKLTFICCNEWMNQNFVFFFLINYFIFAIVMHQFQSLIKKNAFNFKLMKKRPLMKLHHKSLDDINFDSQPIDFVLLLGDKCYFFTVLLQKGCKNFKLI